MTPETHQRPRQARREAVVRLSIITAVAFTSMGVGFIAGRTPPNPVPSAAKAETIYQTVYVDRYQCAGYRP